MDAASKVSAGTQSRGNKIYREILSLLLWFTWFPLIATLTQLLKKVMLLYVIILITIINYLNILASIQIKKRCVKIVNELIVVYYWFRTLLFVIFINYNIFLIRINADYFQPEVVHAVTCKTHAKIYMNLSTLLERF